MRILISDPLAEEGIKILREEKTFKVEVKTGLSPERLKSIIKDYHALIVRSGTKVTEEVIKEAKNLKVIGRAGVGLDNIDMNAANRKGIIVMNAPAGNTVSTAEHTLSLMLSLSRNIPQANTSLKKGKWQRSKFMGVQLYGKTLGIIGLGRIGSEVAKRAISFGMKVIAYDPFISEEIAKRYEVELVELERLLKISDYITIHTPLTDETHHLISDKEFQLMKEDVRIINCARGGIIDEKALIKALQEKRIAGCALDVFEKEPPLQSPLLELENVVVTPHLGASTEEAQVGVAIEIAECVRDALLGRGVRNAANFPSVEPEILKYFQPYIELAEKVGLLAAQLVEGRINKVEICYSGEIISHDVSCLTLALLKGLLSLVLGETVNFVNSLTLAKDRAIKVEEAKHSKFEEFTNLISARLLTDKETKLIWATLFKKDDPRIVKIDNFYVEAIPKGYMLITSNWDRPGIIGAIGTILGRHNINIASMTFGREKPAGKAIVVLNVDSPVSSEILEEIRSQKNILSAKIIKL